MPRLLEVVAETAKHKIPWCSVPPVRGCETTVLMGLDGGECMKYVVPMLAIAACLSLTVWDAAAFPTMQVEAPDKLSRDAVYQGSMTAAAIAVFGYTAVTVIQRISKSDPLSARIDYILVLVGPFAFATLHVMLATLMCCVNPTLSLMFTTGTLSVVFLGIPVIGLIGILKRRS